MQPTFAVVTAILLLIQPSVVSSFDVSFRGDGLNKDYVERNGHSEAVDPDKRGAPAFRLGKRQDDSFDDSFMPDIPDDFDDSSLVDRRYKPQFRLGREEDYEYFPLSLPEYDAAKRAAAQFRLGKREDLNKRAAPSFRLGKRSENDADDKRSMTPSFRLGKRMSELEEAKRGSAPSFRLGKREMSDEEDEKRAAPSFRLGKRAPSFRLGKRPTQSEVVDADKKVSAPSFRLGKRYSEVGDVDQRAPSQFQIAGR